MGAFVMAPALRVSLGAGKGARVSRPSRKTGALIARGTLCPGHKRVPRAHGIINFGRGL